MIIRRLWQVCRRISVQQAPPESWPRAVMMGTAGSRGVEIANVEWRMNGLIRKLFQLSALAALLSLPGTGAGAAGTAVHIEIKGAIGPATSGYLLNGIEHADEIDAPMSSWSNWTRPAGSTPRCAT